MQFQVSIAVLLVATLTRNFAKPVRNPQAARKGAPQARQIADRFHLAQNLTDRIEVILARCRTEIRKAQYISIKGFLSL
jgi:hypothetical protein